MKRVFSFWIFCILYISVLPTFAQNKDAKNIVGFGMCYIPSMEHGMYFDSPFDIWPDQEPSGFGRIFYARQLSDAFRLGAYCEYGRSRFSVDGGEVRSYRRTLGGLDWLVQYPHTPLHLQLGGYFGFGRIKADNWNNLKGADFGMLAGPAYDFRHFGVSVQMKAGFAPFGATGTPEGVLMYAPGVLVKLYGKF
ncbi:MAG: hypothetical protein IPH45_11140 [Bacteroidales bacterium]|nr:hypothetical protein [Bacteroidales bacterium]